MYAILELNFKIENSMSNNTFMDIPRPFDKAAQ